MMRAPSGWFEVGFGFAIVGVSAAVAGEFTRMGEYVAAAALLVPLVIGLVHIGRALDAPGLEDRQLLRGEDTGGLLFTYYAGIAVSMWMGNPPPAAAIMAVLGVATFFGLGRLKAWRDSGSLLAPCVEVSPD